MLKFFFKRKRSRKAGGAFLKLLLVCAVALGLVVALALYPRFQRAFIVFTAGQMGYAVQAEHVAIGFKGVEVNNLTYIKETGEGSPEIKLESAQATIAWWRLFTGQLHVKQLNVEGLVVNVPASAPAVAANPAALAAGASVAATQGTGNIAWPPAPNTQGLLQRINNSGLQYRIDAASINAQILHAASNTRWGVEIAKANAAAPFKLTARELRALHQKPGHTYTATAQLNYGAAGGIETLRIATHLGERIPAVLELAANPETGSETYTVRVQETMQGKPAVNLFTLNAALESLGNQSAGAASILTGTLTSNIEKGMLTLNPWLEELGITGQGAFEFNFENATGYLNADVVAKHSVLGNLTAQWQGRVDSDQLSVRELRANLVAPRTARPLGSITLIKPLRISMRELFEQNWVVRPGGELVEIKLIEFPLSALSSMASASNASKVSNTAGFVNAHLKLSSIQNELAVNGAPAAEMLELKPQSPVTLSGGRFGQLRGVTATVLPRLRHSAGTLQVDISSLVANLPSIGQSISSELIEARLGPALQTAGSGSAGFALESAAGDIDLGSAGNLKGTVTVDATGTYLVALNSTQLNMDALLAAASQFAPSAPQPKTAKATVAKLANTAAPDAQPAWPAMAAQLQANLADVRLGGHMLQTLRTHVILAPENITLQHLAAEALGGTFNAHGSVNFAPNLAAETAYTYTLNLESAGWSLEEALSKGFITGEASLNAALTGSAPHLNAAFLNTAQGTATLQSTGGRLQLMKAAGLSTGTLAQVSKGAGLLNQISAISGTQVAVPSFIQKVGGLGELLSSIDIYNVNIGLTRGEDLTTQLNPISIAGPTLQITGQGSIEGVPSLAFTQQPLSVNLFLNAKEGKLANALQSTGWLSKENQNAQGYYTGPDFNITGTLASPKTDTLYRIFAPRADGKPTGLGAAAGAASSAASSAKDAVVESAKNTPQSAEAALEEVKAQAEELKKMFKTFL